MKRILLVIAAALTLMMGFPSAANAMPAYNGLKSYVQPDQTVIEYRLMGDERFNWRETPEGDVILLDQNSKYYCYSQLKNNEIVKTAQRVGVDKKPFIRLTRKNLLSVADYSLRNNYKINGLNPHASLAPAAGDLSYAPLADGDLSYAPLAGGDLSYAPLSLAPFQNILVVLVEFDNIGMQESDLYWNQKFFSDTTKSVNHYYQEVSRDKISFIPAGENHSDPAVQGTINDGVVRVQMDYSHPAVSGFEDTDEMWDAIVATATDAVVEASYSATDLGDYDTNGNGVLETSELHIITLFAGYEMSSDLDDPTGENAIWAHAMDFGTTGNVYLNGGLKLGGYMAVGEQMTDTPISIGVFCHELGHSLGLPDLYDYGYDSMGLGYHSLMAAGSWGRVGSEPYGATPVHLDAWSKIQLGFMTPTDLTGSGSYTVNAQSTADYNILRIGNGLPGQYFLIERRAQSGYDAALANYYIDPGVAIYHIDENVMTYGQQYLEGLINENEYRKAVDLEEANQGYLGYSEMDTYPKYWDGRHYFTASLFNTFGAATVPSSGLYDKPIISPFASIPSNGTQDYPSGVEVKVTSLGLTSAGLSITMPGPSFHVASIPNKTYTGSPIQPTVVVDDGNSYLQQGVDFTVSYLNNVFPGKAVVNVIGIGDYEGVSGTGNFVIVPKSLTSLTVQLNEKYADPKVRYRTIKASWPAATGASGYYLAYRASTSETWTGVFVTGTSWTKPLSAGTKYYVKVKPYVVIDGTTRNYSTTFSPETSRTTLKAPGVSLAKYGTRSVKVSLGSVTGESGYEIRRATSLNGTYYLKKKADANTAYWIDSTTYVGKTYYYKVRVYKVVNGVTIYGPYSSVKSIKR